MGRVSALDRIKRLSGTAALACLISFGAPADTVSALPTGCAWHVASNPKFIPNHYLTCPTAKGDSEIERQPQGVGGTDTGFDETTFPAADAGDAKAMRMVGDFLLEYAQTRNQPALAVAWYRRAAALGDGVAMVALSRAYWSGRGVERDLSLSAQWLRSAQDAAVTSKDAGAMVAIGLTLSAQFSSQYNRSDALHWYKMAADMGSAHGMFAMSVAYEFGYLAPTDRVNALQWARAAAAAGDPTFETLVGSLYRRGLFPMTKDAAEAVRLYRLAAAQNDATAMLFLARMYEQGDGIETNASEAARWYRGAAELGDANAMEALGAMYRDGRGVKANTAAWAHWFDAAASRRKELPPPIAVAVIRGAPRAISTRASP